MKTVFRLCFLLGMCFRAASSDANTIVVDSFDGPDVAIHSDGKLSADLLLDQRHVGSVLGERRYINVGAGGTNDASLVIKDGAITISPRGGEGASFIYGYDQALNLQLSEQATVEIDFTSTPFENPQSFEVSLRSKGQGYLVGKQQVGSGRNFTARFPVVEMTPSTDTLNVSSVLDNIAGIVVTAPGIGPYGIGEIRIVPEPATIESTMLAVVLLFCLGRRL